MKSLQDGFLVARCALMAVAVAATGTVGYTAFHFINGSEHDGVVARTDVAITEMRGEVIAAAANEFRNERLPDGTLVAMAPSTRFQYDFSGSRRLVALLRGKAKFTVAHNPKPFTVQTPLIDATAIGTSFTVWVTECLKVEVDEGVVQVSGRGAAAGLVRTLQAGQSLDLAKNCSLVLAQAPSPSDRSGSTVAR